MRKDSDHRLLRRNEQGFILVSSLVVILLLTILSVGLFYRNTANQQTSAADRDTKQAYYYAEAALNYLVWAVYSDPGAPTSNNNGDLDEDGVGDRAALAAQPDQVSTQTIQYFDVTTPLSNRAVSFTDPLNPPQPVLATIAPNGTVSGTVPKHVTFDMTTNDTSNSVAIAPSWAGGTGKPAKDGAIVWITAGVLDSNPSNEIDSTDTSGNYALIAYAIGYVNGRPVRMLRAKIGSVQNSLPGTIGSITNGYL